MKMNYHVVIPARANSKRLPGKNMKILGNCKRGFFPSRSTIGNRALSLEKLANRYVPFEEYTSEGGNPNIKFDYDAVLWCALKALGLWDKALRCGVKILFTLDYAASIIHVPIILN